MQKTRIKGRYRRALVGMLAAAATLAAVASAVLVTGTAQADTTGALRGVGSNRCLDVTGASQTDGTLLQIYDCWGGANQQWTLNSQNALTVYGSKCLDVPGHRTSAGTRV